MLSFFVISYIFRENYYKIELFILVFGSDFQHVRNPVKMFVQYGDLSITVKCAFIHEPSITISYTENVIS